MLIEYYGDRNITEIIVATNLSSIMPERPSLRIAKNKELMTIMFIEQVRSRSCSRKGDEGGDNKM